ncbi:MAG: UDP-3-O-[3-hydroxymyristoyl] N-acetylglucosamine deacetylase [Candidatus Omnitrophica bacterium]|nr:UDP-3-O-[3-hydroxymyristoyl] N-acetylglucosamine deacetylase [Candidatus Omnitrophota bacterium]
MAEKQKTIQSEISIEGVGLHTGIKARLTFKPAAMGTGIQFVRVDLAGAPVVKACFENVSPKDLGRCTALGRGEVVVQTVEHLLGVCCGLGITNLTVEINAAEVPGLDGSGAAFLKILRQSGIVEQAADAEIFVIREAVGVASSGAAIYVSPGEDYHIAYTLDYDHPVLRSQFFSTGVDHQRFETEIAPARTFCLEEEAQLLRAQGLGRGADFNNTLVVGKNGVKNNQVRFSDEFARHKVLDLIGDLYLLGAVIRGHVFAVKSGHNLNYQLLKKIYDQKKKFESIGRGAAPVAAAGAAIPVEAIMRVIPHRYPFLLVDRVFEIEPGKKAVGIKNVTINEGFFQGHFPGRPVMPGVLMIEAMAQVAGVMILRQGAHQGKVAFFMTIDNIKFRRVVVPGDQLVMEVELIKDRGRVAQIRGVAKVDGDIVVEADMMFTLAPAVS